MERILQLLRPMASERHRRFNAMLIPNIAADSILGVKMPQLRRLAKVIANESLATDFMQELPHHYLEEYFLHDILVSQLKDFECAIAATEQLVPYLDNWATCDLLRPKAFAHHTAELLPHINGWLSSPRPYAVRFGMEMLMLHYLDTNFRQDYLELVARANREDYYVHMMTAWYFATALFKQYPTAVKVLETHRLDRWTHNKVIQKATESFRISGEQKAYLKTLRF